jgi:hypothetical protein
MVPTDKYGGSWWLKEGVVTRQVCKLGVGRCEFFLHLGSMSLGCITRHHTSRLFPGAPSGEFDVEPDRRRERK